MRGCTNGTQISFKPVRRNFEPTLRENFFGMDSP